MSKRQKKNQYYRKENTTARNRLIHIIRRFLTRHDLNLSLLDIDEMRAQIISGDAPIVRKKWLKANIYKVLCRGKEIGVAYSKGRDEFITTFELRKKELTQVIGEEIYDIIN